MWFGVVSLFPEMFRIATDEGVLGRAVSAGILEVEVFNPRDFTRDRHRTVDDRPYGGGPGMVMLTQPLLDAIEAAKAAWSRRPGAVAEVPVVYLSPQGRRLDQAGVGEFARLPGLILVAGRYEGIDERVIDVAVHEELSIGDYVLTGGELPAMVVMDAISRQLPGTLGNAASAAEESHLDGLLDYPHYTRPENVASRRVPSALLSGDHSAVARWRRQQALLRTWQRRPDLLVGRHWTEEDRRLLASLIDDGDQN
ncbi:MAG: tRNA (guanosine(37)-N1)-methyltransferase TrmD [Pseudomonadales bacterium]